MTLAYFDCFSGAAGDMIVAALLDAGAPFEKLQASIRTLPISGYSLSVDRVVKQGISATRFCVNLDSSAAQPHRHLKHVVEIIKGGRLSDPVKDHAIAIFTRLAEAEAAVHGATIEKVHFHEVGAIDAIIDVVGACVAMELLGVKQIICSPIPTGSGTVKCEHGVIPVPGPATARLLLNVPLAHCDEVGELTTPTGAAILTTLAAEYSSIPAMTPQSIGFGAGTRESKTRPNVLRVFIGEAATQGDVDEVIVLESNVDDASPQVIAYCLERLLAEGALDAYAMPIHMKKWRTGMLLTALCPLDKADALEAIIFRETPTFGVRRRLMERRVLRRRVERVMTKFGEIAIKIGEREGIETATPEYDECRAAALNYRAAIRDVIETALAAWRERQKS